MNCKYKIILFDIDGVLINLPFYFSKQLERKGYKFAEKQLNKFFHSKEYQQALIGKNDAMRCIEPYLKKMNWIGKTSEYFCQQFNFEIKYLDKNIISNIQILRKNGMKCILCTDQEKHRLNFLTEKSGLKNMFDGCFASSNIGSMKYQDEFWKYILHNIGIDCSEIVFFDDKQLNIETASKRGIKALLFTDFNKFKQDILELKLRFDL